MESRSQGDAKDLAKRAFLDLIFSKRQGRRKIAVVPMFTDGDRDVKCYAKTLGIPRRNFDPALSTCK